MLRAIVINSFDEMKKYIPTETIDKYLEEIIQSNDQLRNSIQFNKTNENQKENITNICNEFLSNISNFSNNSNNSKNSNDSNNSTNKTYLDLKNELLSKVNSLNASMELKDLNVQKDQLNNSFDSFNSIDPLESFDTFDLVTKNQNDVKITENDIPKMLYKKCRDTLDENKRFIIREPYKIINEMKSYYNEYKEKNIQSLNHIVYTVSLELKQDYENTAIYRIGQSLNKSKNVNLSTYYNNDNKMDLINNGVAKLLISQNCTFNDLNKNIQNIKNIQNVENNKVSFISSLVNELQQNEDSHTSVFITTKMNILSLLKLKAGDYVNVSKNSLVGLFNTRTGVGSNFNINLKNDIKISKNDLSIIQIDEAMDNNQKHLYTPLTLETVRNKLETKNINDFLSVNLSETIINNSNSSNSSNNLNKLEKEINILLNDNSLNSLNIENANSNNIENNQNQKAKNMFNEHEFAI